MHLPKPSVDFNLPETTIFTYDCQIDLDRESKWVGRSPQFTTTRWSVIVNSSHDNDTLALEALEQLCRVYWYPLYAFARRRGFSAEDSQDLTQTFFKRLIEKNFVAHADRARGKFRVFLLTAFRN